MTAASSDNLRQRARGISVGLFAALREVVAPARPVLAIDGGVTLDTISTATESGSDMVVSGSAIFRAPAPVAAFKALTEAWSAKAQPFSEAGPEDA